MQMKRQVATCKQYGRHCERLEGTQSDIIPSISNEVQCQDKFGLEL